MFERYTDRARRAVQLAQEEAAVLGHDAVGTDHLLLGLIDEGGGAAFTALEALGVTGAAACKAVAQRHPSGGTRSNGHLPFTPRLKEVFELALREALQLGHHYVGTEHLLLGLIREGGDTGWQALADCVPPEDVRAKVRELLRGHAEADKRAAVTQAAARAGRAAAPSAERHAFAWELTTRMRAFLGHIEDMKDDERLFMLGALTGTLEGMLRDAGVPEPPAAPA